MVGSVLQSSRSRPSTDLALAILARSIAEFLTTADFKYLNLRANTESCCIIPTSRLVLINPRLRIELRLSASAR